MWVAIAYVVRIVYCCISECIDWYTIYSFWWKRYIEFLFLPRSICKLLWIRESILHSSCPLKASFSREYRFYVSFKVSEHCCGSTSEVYRSLPSTHKYITFEWHRALSLFWIINGDTITPDNITRGTKSLSHSRRDEKLSNIDGKLCCSTRYNRETIYKLLIKCIGIECIRWVERKKDSTWCRSIVIAYNRSSRSSLHHESMKHSRPCFHDGRGCCWDICSRATSLCQETIICNILASYSGTKRVEKISICIRL